MTSQLEEQLAEALHRQAGRVTQTGDLAPGAFRLGRRMRWRRRAGTALAGVAALALLVPLGLTAVDNYGKQSKIEPAVTPTSSPREEPTREPSPDTQRKPAKPARVTLDFDQLEVGEAPMVPWLDREGVIHDGERTVQVGGGLKPTGFRPIANGYVVEAKGQIALIRNDGSVVVSRPGNGAVVSRDRQRIAWVAGLNATKRPVVVYSATGELLAEANLGADHVVGFIGGSVLFDRPPADPPGTGDPYLWNPETGDVSRWGESVGSGPVSRSGRVAAVILDEVRPTPEAQDLVPCMAIVETTEMREQWRGRCGVLVEGFSPDERYARTRVIPAMGTMEYTFLDINADRPVLTVSADRMETVVWESADTFLVQAWDGRRASVVRCNLSGECELALEPIEVGNGTAPYRL
ncbi:MAG TPA: hypothetical protein VIL34_13925 [Actinopolymorphaceae bacterium]